MKGQSLFFNLNHPLRRISLAGPIVAIDDYPTRWVLQLDDGSGMLAELMCPRAMARDAPLNRQSFAGPGQMITLGPPKWLGRSISGVDIDMRSIDVGVVVCAEGEMSRYRENMQVNLEKISVLRDTEAEVGFWESLSQTWNTVLRRPWVLEEDEVVRLREEADGTRQAEDKKARREERKERRRRREEERRKESQAQQEEEESDRLRGSDADFRNVNASMKTEAKSPWLAKVDVEPNEEMGSEAEATQSALKKAARNMAIKKRPTEPDKLVSPNRAISYVPETQFDSTSPGKGAAQAQTANRDAWPEGSKKRKVLHLTPLTADRSARSIHHQRRREPIIDASQPRPSLPSNGIDKAKTIARHRTFPSEVFDQAWAGYHARYWRNVLDHEESESIKLANGTSRQDCGQDNKTRGIHTKDTNELPELSGKEQEMLFSQVVNEIWDGTGHSRSPRR